MNINQFIKGFFKNKNTKALDISMKLNQQFSDTVSTKQSFTKTGLIVGSLYWITALFCTCELHQFTRCSFTGSSSHYHGVTQFNDIRALLCSAFFQTLKRKEKEYEHDMERLAREKIATQQRLAELKNELSQWMDVIEIDRVLRQTVQPEEDQASTSTASGRLTVWVGFLEVYSSAIKCH